MLVSPLLVPLTVTEAPSVVADGSVAGAVMSPSFDSAGLAVVVVVVASVVVSVVVGVVGVKAELDGSAAEDEDDDGSVVSSFF